MKKASFKIRSCLIIFYSCLIVSIALAKQIGPGGGPSGWPGAPQLKLGWGFGDPHNPESAKLFSGWDIMPSGTPTAWTYRHDYKEAGQPAQWYNSLPVPQSSDSTMPYVDTYIWYSFVYSCNHGWPASRHKCYSTLYAKRADGTSASLTLQKSYGEIYFDANGKQVPYANATYSCFTRAYKLEDDQLDHIEFYLGTDFFEQNGHVYHQGDIWQPYIQILAHRQRLPTPTLKARVVNSQGQENWIDTDGGTYTGKLTIAVSSPKESPEFHYTTDGSAPSESSPRPYDSGGLKLIDLDKSCTLRVRAYQSGFAYSEARADFTLVVPPPQFAPDYGTFYNTFEISISSRDSDNNPFPVDHLYYTTDGSVPTPSSTEITNGQYVSVSKNAEPLKALAVKTDWHSSESRSANYTLMVSNIVMNPQTGFFPNPTNISVSCATVGASIHYEKGLSPPSPTINSPTAIDGKIPISGSTVVKVKGFKENYKPGPENVGYYIAGATYTYLGTLIPPPQGAYADRDHPPKLYSRGGGGGYITNTVIHGGTTNTVISWTNYVTRGVYLYYTNSVVAVNPGELEIKWWDGGTGVVDSLFIIQNEPSPEKHERKLFWNQPPSKGPLIDVTAVPNLVFYYNENIPEPTNIVNPETVWISMTGKKKYLRARSGTGYLVLLYEGGVTNGPLYGIEVVNVTPDIGWKESYVPVGSQLHPDETMPVMGKPHVSAGLDEKLIYQHNVDGKMKNDVFAIEQNTIYPLMEVFWQEIGNYGFNVNWPYEMHRYTAYWPDENDGIKPARLFVRGPDDDLGAEMFIPGGFNPKLMEAEDYANEFDHGYLFTNIFYSSGPGKSLLQFQTDAGDENPGSEWVGFEVIKSVLREDLLWNYRRVIRLSPAAPSDGFQVEITLPSSFSYDHCKNNGEDLRFYDDNGVELGYWIETWNTTGESVIWVKTVSAGTSTIYLDYGNSKANSLSNPYEVFDFYDDFTKENPESRWNISGDAVLENGRAEIDSGGIAIAKTEIPNSALIETRIGGNGISPVSDTRGSFCGASSYFDADKQFKSDLTGLISNPVSFADWDLGKNGSVAFSGINTDGKYFEYGPTLASVNSNDTMSVAIEPGKIAWFHNGAKVGNSVEKHIPSAPLYPILNSFSAGGNNSFIIDEIRVRKYAETEPTAIVDSEQQGLVIDWNIGTEITDPHQESPGSGYIYESQGNRFEPNIYNYPELDSQIFAVNVGTVEVWWSSWILTNRVADGIQIPSFVRRYNNVWPEIPTNYAFDFNGSDNYIEIKPQFNQLSNWTFSAWIKPESSGYVYSEGNPLDTLNVVVESSGKLRVGIWNKNYSGNWMNFYTSADAVKFHEWNFISVKLENGGAGEGDITVFVNSNKFTGALQMENHDNTPYAEIGINVGSLHGGNQIASPFHGEIDEVRLWNNARTDSEILEDMNNELDRPADEENLVSYYKFNGDDPVTAIDNSGFENNGAVHGAVRTIESAPIHFANNNLGQLIIASSLGGKPFKQEWKNPYIYSQNDPDKKGYNPNEEHAIIYSGIPYALRNDLNRKNASSAYTSEPYVIMPYINPDDNKYRIQIYKVITTNETYHFLYDNNYAAKILSPPDPLASWPGTKETIIAQGPGWRDRKEQIWAKAGGNAGPDSGAAVIMQWFYPNIDQSWFIPSWYQNYIVNNNIPLLDRFAGTPGTPVSMTYNVYWENNYPTLNTCDTLVEPRNGLPDIAQQTSVDIIYQQSEENANYGDGPAVQLIDPTRMRNAYLPNDYALPNDLLKKTTVIDGHYFFGDLPPNLVRRLWYDPLSQEVYFKGEYVKLTSSEVDLKGYLLLNVINDRDRNTLTNYFAPYNHLNTAIERLCADSKIPIIVTNDAIPFDSLALTAGLSKGTGYVTLVFGNSTNELMQPQADPIEMQVINVALPLFQGEIEQVGLEANPFSDQVNIRHSSDFLGEPENYIFDWRFVLPDSNGEIPANKTNIANWSKYPYLDPENGKGANDVTISGENLFALDNHYFAVRYRHANPGFPGGTSWSEWTPPKYVEGWVQRVLDSITPFEQRYYDFYNTPINTLVSMISQIGPRWDGNIPLDPDSINQWGLLQIYMTILKTAMNMSINADPPHHDANANKVIMLAAGRIADLYTLLGNEAYADAQDPTIGFDTDDEVYGHDAPSIHCFMNQTPSLLEETLALLRGRGEGSPIRAETPPIEPPVWTSPFYNRLIWNFTKDITGGEVAYALNYNILDENGNADGIINEEDAAILYPMGHGDAWGHYLSALNIYYILIHNKFFDWIPGTYAENVGNSTVLVDYYHEKKFCDVAAAKARTGAEIVENTYKKFYDESPTAQWQGYSDSDTNRAWGVGEWAARAGMGAYFDWVVANSVLPTDSAETGVAKIDRTNVTELASIARSLSTVQNTVDNADRGLNPLGLARNVVPFDIDPSQVFRPDWVPMTSKSHFEQIYDRAVKALNNAASVFNYAKGTTQKLRQQADSLNKFHLTIRDKERDYEYRLIELYGYPYPDDVGPGGTYNSGYNGPDLFHWMYLDNTYLAANDNETENVTLNSVYYTSDDDGKITKHTQAVTYHILADSQMAVRPDEWTSPRPAVGEIQIAYSDYLQMRGQFAAKLKEYNNQIELINYFQNDLLEKLGNNSNVYLAVKHKYTEVATMNSLILVAKTISFAAKSTMLIEQGISDATKDGSPYLLVAGLADGVDPSFLARMLATEAEAASLATYFWMANIKNLLITAQDFAKELIDIHIEIVNAENELQNEFVEDKATLEREVKKLGVVLKELYTLEQAVSQSYGAFKAKLMEGYRVQDYRARFRQETAAEIQNYRYKDMAFRIFRNDALQKYDAQFDLAAKYAYLAAKAYDYETALKPGDPRGAGSDFLKTVVKANLIGIIENGEPQIGPITGDGGIADALAKMKLNWDLVLKGQLGFNNPEVETSKFSFRRELFRCIPDSSAEPEANLNSLTGLHWKTVLQKCVVSNIFDIPEFNRYCIPFDPHNDVEPGIVIEFSTTIEQGKNFFGWPLAGGDSAYDSTHFATKIRSLGIWFSNYDNTSLAEEPRVYLFPVGTDTLRSPGGDGSYYRTWKVLDQALPVPYPATQDDIAREDWIPLFDTFSTQFAANRRYPTVRAYNDSGDYTQDEAIYASRLIGRSVWNTKWMMIIPASTFNSDRDFAIENFINNVTDIKIFFETYSYSGN